MAVTLTVSAKELERQAQLVFEGKTYKMFLAVNSGSLTSESTAAAWEAVELSGNGYAAVTGTIGTGSYDSTDARYELPAINATYSATGSGFTYDTICLKIGSELYLHSVCVESPSITLADGESKNYAFSLVQDN